MRRESEHRLSISKRIGKLERILADRFPLNEKFTVHWSHCVNDETVTSGIECLNVLTQITGSQNLSEACTKIGLKITDDIVRHAALKLYNSPRHDLKWSRDWQQLEIRAIDRAVHDLIVRMRAKYPRSPTSVTAPLRAA